MSPNTYRNYTKKRMTHVAMQAAVRLIHSNTIYLDVSFGERSDDRCGEDGWHYAQPQLNQILDKSD